MFPSLGITSTVTVIVISVVNWQSTALAATGRLADKVDLASSSPRRWHWPGPRPSGQATSSQQTLSLARTATSPCLYALATVGLWTSVAAGVRRDAGRGRTGTEYRAGRDQGFDDVRG